MSNNTDESQKVVKPVVKQMPKIPINRTISTGYEIPSTTTASSGTEKEGSKLSLNAKEYIPKSKRELISSITTTGTTLPITTTTTTTTGNKFI
jgi:hypothetical protein